MRTKQTNDSKMKAEQVKRRKEDGPDPVKETGKGVPVYVQDKDGNPLMPTFRNGKVRRMLKDGLAVVVRGCPFTIRLTYEPKTHIVQRVILGVDPGYGTVGFSAGTIGRELICGEVALRDDVVGKVSTKRELRRSRRSRKQRYRAPRFDNRKRKKGGVSPSVRSRCDAHLSVIRTVCSVLPVERTVVEMTSFDVRKLKDPEVSGEGYQHGERDGFFNTREYVLHRDGHRCRNCGGKSGDRILEVHHLESRKTGGDSPGNLVTLCRTCHTGYHAGTVELKIKRAAPLKSATVMNMMKGRLFLSLRKAYPDKEVLGSFAYQTKSHRIDEGLGKSHANDAYCISGNLGADRCPVFIRGKQIPRHTRSLHVQKTSKGGKRRSTVAPHRIGKSDLQRYDVVKYRGEKAVIAGSTNGRLVLRDMDWKKTTKEASVNATKVKFQYRKKGSVIYMSSPARETELKRGATLWDIWMESIDRDPGYWDDLAREFAGMKKSEQ